MIVYDDNFLTELDDNRTLALTGRLSSGKTLMAVQLAQRYLRRGYKLISQTACVWNDPIETVIPDERGRYRVVCIIDEGGLYFRKQTTASAVSSFAAKLDTYLIFAGRKLPHMDLCSLTAQMWFNAAKWFGFPFKVWRYDVNNGQKAYAGYFIETAWWDYYGVYDTLDPGDNPEQIVSKFREWTQYFFERYNRTYRVSDVDAQRGEDESEFSNELAASVQTFARAAQTVSKQQAWRRR